jgi:hypothetical protein
MIKIKLKSISKNKYCLFSPSGYRLGPVYKGTKDEAIRWAKAFCSSWYYWNLDCTEIDDE